MKSLFSIIVPVYQAKNYLSSCIDSILNQTNKDFEIILVDDGSNDGSQTICDEYSKKYDNVYCIHQKNQGVSCARNAGIERAKGEYILFVDSDDYIAPNYFEEAAKALENKEADMFLCGYQNVIKRGKIRQERKLPLIDEGIWKHQEFPDIVLSLFQTSVLHAIGTKIYKREIIIREKIRFNEKWKYYEDIFFCLSYMLFCKNIFVKNEIMYFYQRDVANSLSKQHVNIEYKSVYSTYRVLAHLIQIKKLSEIEKKRFFEAYIESINGLIDTQMNDNANYTMSTHKLYEQICKDKIFHSAIRHLNKQRSIEYLLIKLHFYFGAYIFRFMSKG